MQLKLRYEPKLYVCSCCGEAKPATEFYIESYTDRRTNQCKQCINIKRRVQRNKAKHGKFVSKEKIRNMEAVDYQLADWRDAMLHFGAACAFCGKPEGRAKKEKLDRDHLVALSKGGKTVRNNIIPACAKCNRGRGNREWLEWFKNQPFYGADKAKKIAEWQRGVEYR